MRRSLVIAIAAALTIYLVQASAAETSGPAEPKSFTVRPIGHIEKAQDVTQIVLDKKYQSGLLGLEGYSHLLMFWWFDKNDTPQKRSILQVHPMGNRANPLTGVFATRSPVRPNLIAMTLCKIVSVKDNTIEIEKTDAFDGTPVLDIKPFIPGYDSAEGATVPKWLAEGRKRRDAEKERAQQK